MLAKKIIPCLDIRDGRVVKGVKFEGIQDVTDPVEAAAFYNAQGADELVFYDITASLEGRSLSEELLRKVAGQISIPLTVGGGINTIDDFEWVLGCGADKVSVNSGAIKNPGIIAEAAKKYGSSRVVLGMDVKRVGSGFNLFSAGGRTDTGIDAIEWVRRAQESGAGELVVNSIDTDGVRGGFDIEMLSAVRAASTLPIVASGGAGTKEHFLQLFEQVDVEAGLAASIFHFKELLIPDLKSYLSANGVAVQMLR